MAGQLITLPVRLWWRGAMLILHTAEDATELALSATLRLAGAVENLRSGGSWTEPDHAPVFSEPAPRPSAERARETEGRASARETETRASERGNGNGAGPELASERLAREGFTTSVDVADTGAEPVHVSEEPVLVEESAEPGAEEGAGASVHVQEPWDGYQRMNAREVIARCGDATMAQLVAVQLDESGHRNRQTVLQAVARAMKSPGRTL